MEMFDYVSGVRRRQDKRPEITDKDAKIRTFMHYTDPDANREVTVFGRKRANLHYNYSDRLEQWDYAKWRAGIEIAKSQGIDEHTARYYEIALSHFRDSPCNLQHIVLGCNRSSGFHYLIFGYTYEAQVTGEERGEQ